MKSILLASIILISASAFATSLYRGEYEAAHCVSADRKVQVELILHTEDEKYIVLRLPTIGGHADYKGVQAVSKTFRNGVIYTAKFPTGYMSLDLEQYTNANKNNRKGLYISHSYDAPNRKSVMTCTVPSGHHH